MYPLELVDVMSNFIIIYVAVMALYFFMRSQKQKKRSASMYFIKRWNDGRYQRVFSQLSSNPENTHRDIRDVLFDSASKWESDDYFKELEGVWNFFEELSIAIIFGEADEEIAKEFFIYSLINTYRISERALHELRRNNSKALYLNMERLYGKWTSNKEYLLVKEVYR